MPSSRRILLNTWGSYGDLFPYLAIAVRLKALGHVPVLATCAYYRELVEAAGIEFRAVVPDVDSTDATLIARVMDPRHGTEVVVKEMIVPHVREAYQQLSALVRDADVVVTHPVTFAAPLAARAAKRRWLSSVLAPASMFSLTDFPVFPPAVNLMRILRLTPWTARAFMNLARRITGPWTRPIRDLACELGLEDAGDPLYEGQFSPDGTLALFSPLLGRPQPDWPPNAAATGFLFYDDGRELSGEVRAFLDAGPPPIVFTLGSSAVGAPGRFWDESLEAIATLKRRALLLAGGNEVQRLTAVAPPTVCVTGYAPHAKIFDRASAVVHHGGVGTTAQALRSSTPMLVVPHAHDQPDNAFRASRLGVACVLTADRYRAAAVARLLKQLLQDDRYRTRAAEVGRAVSAERGADTACAVILKACG